MKIKVLAMDVDGTLTDGKIHIGEKGEIFKSFYVKDGYAIHDMLPPMGIIPIIITGRTSKIVEYRCKELGVEYIIQGSQNKQKDLESILTQLNVKWNEVAYIGDDLNDLHCMKCVGFVGCPADAAEGIKSQADFISEYPGGCGAVREFVERLEHYGEKLLH